MIRIENITVGINMLIENLKNLKQGGVAAHPPEWLQTIPILGEYADKAWVRITQLSQEDTDKDWQ